MTTTVKDLLSSRFIAIILFSFNLTVLLFLLVVPNGQIVNFFSFGEGRIVGDFFLFLDYPWIQWFTIRFSILHAVVVLLFLFAIKLSPLLNYIKLHEKTFFTLLALVLVLIYDGVFLVEGVFYNDDFRFLSCIEGRGFWEYLFLPYHGAVAPYSRFVFWVATYIDPYSALPFSVLALFFSFVTLRATVSFLGLYEISFSTKVMFMFFYAGLTAWGTINGRFYSVMNTSINTTMPFFVGSVIFGVSYVGSNYRSHLIISSLLAAIPILTYTTGAWVLIMMPLFVAERTFGRTANSKSNQPAKTLAKRNALLVFATLAAFLAFSAILYILYNSILDRISIEQNDVTLLTASGIVYSMIYVFVHGVVNPIILPGMMVQHILPQYNLWWVTYIPSILVTIFLLFSALRSSRNFFLLFPFILITILFILAPVLFRHTDAFEHYLYPHYIVFPTFWLLLTLVVSFEMFRKTSSPNLQRSLSVVLLYSLSIYLFAQGYVSASSFYGTGRSIHNRGYIRKYSRLMKKDLSYLEEEINRLANILPNSKESLLYIPDLNVESRFIACLSLVPFPLSIYKSHMNISDNIRFIRPPNSEGSLKLNPHVVFECTDWRDRVPDEVMVHIETNPLFNEMCLNTDWFYEK